MRCPDPTDELITAARDRMNVYVRGLQIIRAETERRRQRGTRKLVDIGCNAGVFMMLAKNSGYVVTGVEQSIVGRWLRDNLRFPVFERLSDVAPETADVVTLWDVLEHTEKPKEVLAEIKRITKPGGILALKVPHGPNSLLFHRVHPKTSNALGIPEHVQFFSPRSLRQMLAACGLSVCRVIAGDVENGLGASISVRLKLLAKVAINRIVPSSIVAVAERPMS
jgi:SAM-dependent methyltransferase